MPIRSLARLSTDPKQERVQFKRVIVSVMHKKFLNENPETCSLDLVWTSSNVSYTSIRNLLQHAFNRSLERLI